jgi:hypothetical protein
MADAVSMRKIISNFLENYPPASHIDIDAIVSSGKLNVYIPRVKLYCDNDECTGIRIFEPSTVGVSLYEAEKFKTEFLEYKCRNCENKLKLYAIFIIKKTEDEVRIFKLGELPAFGPKIPSQLLDLLNDDVDLFQKGSNCENQGQGIGAFSYYRRVLDNQKNKLIDELIRVAQSIGAETDFIQSLEEARKETGFSSSVKKIKKVIQDGFKLNGENPLSMLNTALSRGLHARTDEECLEVAKDIRIIFQHLATKLNELSTDDNELKDAIKNIKKFSQTDS